jgi:hypothetical protein
MIGESIRKKIVSQIVLTMKRPAPPNALRDFRREPHDQRDDEQRHAGVGPDEARRAL